MTGKYLELQKEGLSLYVDHGLCAARMDFQDDGNMVFDSYEAGQKAVKKMARTMRDAGGMFWVNQPSGPWADLGYIELGGWDSDSREDWRLVGDKLQIYKLHEFRPNTIIPLYAKSIEYIHQCLAYNFLPQVMTKEMVRLRWYLREAEMAPDKVVLENGKDGYQGQTNEEMTTGQWGGAAGCDSHGSVNGPDV
jgi:hypothetical protein